MTIFDDINLGFNELARSIQNSGIFDLVSSLGGIILVCVLIGLFLFGMARIFKRSREYVRPDNHLGTYKIGIRNNYYLVGNLNKNKSWTVQDVFDRLKRIQDYPEIKDGLSEIEKLWKNNLFHCYDFRVHDDILDFSSNIELPSNDVVILSPVPLEDPNVHWEDKKGERAFTGSATDMFKRYPKNILCSEYTNWYDVPDNFGNVKRVYIVAPYIAVMNEQMILQPEGMRFVEDKLHGKKAFINIINLPNKESLARLAVLVESLNDLYKELEIKDQKLKNVIEQRDKYNEFADMQAMEKEGYRAQLKLPRLFGEETPIVPITPKSLMMIAFACVMIGGVAHKIGIMDMFRNYDGIEWVIVIAAGVIVLAIMKLFEDKEKKKDRFAVQQVGDKI